MVAWFILVAEVLDRANFDDYHIIIITLFIPST